MRAKQQYRTVKKYSKNPNKVKSTSLWLNVLKMWCKEKKEIKENEPEKLNLLLKTDYAEVEKKTKTKTATNTCKSRQLNLFGIKWTKIQVFHHNNNDFRCRRKEKAVQWLSLSFLSSKDLYENIGRSGSFHRSSKRNRKFNDKHLVQTKPKGENTISNIMKTIHSW